MATKNYSIIIFDCFGVLYDEVTPQWFQRYFGAEEGAQRKPEYFIPADLGTLEEEQLWEQLAALVHRSADAIRQEFNELARPRKEVLAYARELSASHKIILGSNACAPWQRRIFERDGVTDLFDHLFISSEMGIRKPDRAFFEHILDALGVEAESILFIDDKERNIIAAREVGMDALRCDSTQQVLPDLKRILCGD